MLNQIVDGFSYNTVYRPSNRNFFTHALAQMDVLRRASNYRARWWVIPDAQGQPIQPYDTFDFQCEVADRSYLWGYNFVIIKTVNPSQQVIANNLANIQIQVVDSCTKVPLFQDYASGANTGTSFEARYPVILLSRPRLILEPGLVAVSLTNTTANTITCQLILLFAEACKVIDTQMPGTGQRLSAVVRGKAA